MKISFSKDSIKDLSASIILAFCCAEKELAASYHFSLGSESGYLSEGRNHLPENSSLVIKLGGELKSFNYEFSERRGSLDSYQESNIHFGYRWKINPLEIELGSSYLIFENEEREDIEINLGITTNLTKQAWIFLESVYSKEANGTFLTFGIGYTFPFSEKLGILAITVSESIDIGYATELYDGWNHFEIDFDYEIAWDQWRLNLFLSKSFDQDDIKLEGEKAALVYGGSIQVDF